MQENSHKPEASMSQITQNTLMKDLLIPISIVVAGIFIGAGLYFGGGQSTGVPIVDEKEPEDKTLLSLALAAGVDEGDFVKCFEEGETLNEVQEDLDDAIETGGRGTPWGIIIGPTGKKYPVNGALPQPSLEQLIELAKSESGSQTTEENLALEKMNPVTDKDHIKGNLDAEVVIVEYSDFDCPFCTRFHTSMNAISDKYPDNELAWVYRHFPLEQLHPQAKAVSVASECVAKLAGNEAFWKFTDSYLK